MGADATGPSTVAASIELRGVRAQCEGKALSILREGEMSEETKETREEFCLRLGHRGIEEAIKNLVGASKHLASGGDTVGSDIALLSVQVIKAFFKKGK